MTQKFLTSKTTMGKSLPGASLRPGCLCNEPQAISGEGLLQLEKKARVWSGSECKSTYFRLVSEGMVLTYTFIKVKVCILKSPAVPKFANLYKSHTNTVGEQNRAFNQQRQLPLKQS